MFKRLILAVTALSYQQMPLQVQWENSAMYLTRPTDIAGSDHEIFACSTPSNCGGTAVPGIAYIASAPLACAPGQIAGCMSSYTAGQWWVVIPDVPTQSGANLNIGGLGPLAIVGACSRVCIMAAVGPTSAPTGPPTALVVQ
jgi:hypothetical protein